MSVRSGRFALALSHPYSLVDTISRPGIDLKKAAKQFAQKFATGASVTKNPQGLEEIIVQGDVSGEILELIEEGAGVLKGIPIDNVVEVEEKPKKKGGD